MSDGCLIVRDVVDDFTDWYKRERPEYQSWRIEYFCPSVRIKITVPDGAGIDAEYQLTKIVGLGFTPNDFEKIVHLLGEKPSENSNDEPVSFLFSENLWLVDKEHRHHLIVGYIIRRSQTLILLQFWLRAKGMYDLIGNSPIGILFFPVESEDVSKAVEKLSAIIQSGIGEYRVIVADLSPFENEEPIMLAS